ncbi:MAG: pyridoxal 5'-phosphate synthase glutaminase subunit PdxT [Deltaproteobacteria bacterium]|nr:pyridoxal 5'-phosphate synthase glutaminase subunit PdxT [Deltaproteobacteria bacterium]
MNSESPELNGAITSAIGVLDLQGGVSEHIDHLERLGIRGIRVKKADDFQNLAGLILPGGESTCMSRLLSIFNLDEMIERHFRRGMKIWGTCAGAILLASSVVGESPCLRLIDIEIERNSFGSQMDSFTRKAHIPGMMSEAASLTFIRAPKIKKVGPDVSILLQIDDYIAAAESPEILVTIFHPELTGCLDFHRYFTRKCHLKPRNELKTTIDPSWNNTSWTRLARIGRG